EQTPLPICIGFGISSAETARTLAPVADGIIVGSAFVRRINQFEGEEREREIGAFAKSLIEAIR
ncbi:MAG: tryptophan synthase subunit alpha, partial [Planctomycetota bacterium]